MMLSRGIDPDVTDPSKCHSHPEVPARWPSRAELQQYSDSVRALLRRGLADGPSADMRLVCLALEHERMHQETLSYMITQQVTLISPRLISFLRCSTLRKRGHTWQHRISPIPVCA